MTVSQSNTDFNEYPYDDECFNRGVQHVVDLLAKTINAPDTWHSGDGSEDYDEDLAETLRNILEARGLYDRDTGEFPAQPSQGAGNGEAVAWQEALKPFAAFADALSEEVPDDIALGIFADGAMRFGPSGGSADVGSLRKARAALAAPQPTTADHSHASLQARVEKLEALLPRLVDWVHLYATEGHSWISETTTSRLIALAVRAPAQADADHFKNNGSLAALNTGEGEK